MSDLLIRPANSEDLPRLTVIYNHYVINTPITFDLEPYTVERRMTWFQQFATTGSHRLLVAEVDGMVVGYAGTTRFRPKPAYDTTVETTIYLSSEAAGKGIGSSYMLRSLSHWPMRTSIASWLDIPYPTTRPRRCMTVRLSVAAAFSMKTAASSVATGMSPGQSDPCGWKGSDPRSMPFEILHCPFVLPGFVHGGERSQIATLAGFSDFSCASRAGIRPISIYGSYEI